jgi:single-strand DNA-binding protein
VNQLSLIGNLTKDPTLRYTPTGKPVCDLRVAVNGVSDAPPLFLDVATFGPQAEACARHLHKGRQVGFTGQLVYREWVSQDGTRRSRHSAVGRVQFLGAPPADAAAGHGDGDEAELDAIIAPAEDAEHPA